MNDRFFVLWPDGQKFGPADVQTLQRWAVENRIGPATLLEDEHSGRHVRAVDVPALQPVLNLPMNMPSANPGFVPANPSAGTTEVTIAWILGAIGLCCFGMGLGAAGIVLSIIAMQKGQRGAVAALIFNIVVIVLSLVGIAFLSMANRF
jgi:hypothetical protein